jgi:hypothetical protein
MERVSPYPLPLPALPRPQLFPWPAEPPSLDMLAARAEYVLRGMLPHLAALPALPEVVFGPLGDPPGAHVSVCLARD